MNFKTNCKNCGAPLKHEPYETIVKCGYCGSEFHKDRFGRFEENYITINFMGKERRFYIGTIQCEPVYSEVGRDLCGNISRTIVREEPIIELTLISC